MQIQHRLIIEIPTICVNNQCIKSHQIPWPIIKHAALGGRLAAHALKETLAGAVPNLRLFAPRLALVEAKTFFGLGMKGSGICQQICFTIVIVAADAGRRRKSSLSPYFILIINNKYSKTQAISVAAIALLTVTQRALTLPV